MYRSSQATQEKQLLENGIVLQGILSNTEGQDSKHCKWHNEYAACSHVTLRVWETHTPNKVVYISLEGSGDYNLLPNKTERHQTFDTL